MLKRKLWLIWYYFNNLIFIKIPSKIHYIRQFSYRDEATWSSLKKEFSQSDTFLVVGNGPSLKLSDLEPLGKKMPSIASNKINLLFEDTTWRPSFVTICDTLLAYKLRKSHFEGIDKLLCAHTIFFMLKGAGKKKLPWKNITLDEAWNEFESNGCFKPDPVETGIFEGFSITNQNIQLAIWLGAKKIYLIGIDHFYDEGPNSQAGAKMVHEGQNHFHPDYRKKGEVVNNAPVEKMDDAYRKMNEIAKSNGVEVINISRKTALEAFVKKSTDEVIEEWQNKG